MILFMAWSGDAAWLFYLLSFIYLGAGVYGVARYYRKISNKYKDSEPNKL
jgi:hypothetical protein